MDGTSKQRRSVRENTNKKNTWNRKETAKISLTHNEEAEFGEFNTHGSSYQGQEKYGGVAAENLPDEFV